LHYFAGVFFFYIAEGVGKLAKKRIIFYSFLISLCIQLLSLLGLLILVNLLNTPLPDYLTLMAVSSVVILIGIIPVTPGNIGWVELVASMGWSAIGSNAGGILFFYWRIITILFTLPWGILYIFKRA
jgi:uncharacterized membrane protein YbhN (UPF0104 family)